MLCKSSWNSENLALKQEKFRMLNELKKRYPSYQVIYGCISDNHQRRFIEGNVEVLTGDYFLEYMLGDAYPSIEGIIKNLIHNYLESLDSVTIVKKNSPEKNGDLED